MNRNVVRLFSLYNFFSVFLPGFVFLLGITPLLPAGVPTNAVTTLIPFLALGFVVGQAIHSLAVRAERAFGHERHRTRFTDELAGRTNRLDDGLVQEFRTCYSASTFQLPLDVPDDDGEAADSSLDNSAIYALVQSHIHTEEAGRSRTFQAIYAFCRSLWFESFFLMFFYWSFVAVAAVVDIEYPLLVLSTTDLPETLLISTVICGFSVFVFKYAADQYQEYFVQYLLTDFVVINRKLSEGE